MTYTPGSGGGAAVLATTVTGPATVDLPAGFNLVICDVSAGNIVIHLPDDGVDHPPTTIKRKSSSIVAHTVTFSLTGSAVWDSSQTTGASLQGRNEALTVVGHFDGSHVQWYTLAYSAHLNAEGTQSGSLSVSGGIQAGAISTNNLSQNFGATLGAMISGQDFDNPAIAAGAGAGTSPTFTTPIPNGTDIQGHVDFTTGTSPAVGKICTITLVNASFTFSKLVFCAFVQGDDSATQALDLYAVEDTTAGNVFDVYCRNAPAASTSYSFKYAVFRQ